MMLIILLLQKLNYEDMQFAVDRIDETQGGIVIVENN